MSNIYSRIFNICTQYRCADSENQMYILYLEYCRIIYDKCNDTEEVTAIKTLQNIFKYIDRYYVNY